MKQKYNNSTKKVIDLLRLIVTGVSSMGDSLSSKVAYTQRNVVVSNITHSFIQINNDTYCSDKSTNLSLVMLVSGFPS